MTICELWMPCPRFEGIYEVSDSGRVRRIVSGAGRAKAGAFLRPSKNPKGYPLVILCRDGVQTTTYIHRLVCEAFHGMPPTATHQAAHRDDDKDNNTESNLYWATPKQNGGEDRRRNDRIMHGSRCGMAKLTENDVHLIRAMRLKGFLLREIAEKFGVRPHTISRILTGNRWPHMVAVPQLGPA